MNFLILLLCIISQGVYLLCDHLCSLNHYFNWSLSYRADSRFPAPYGRLEQTTPHPTGPDLTSLVSKFGRVNSHLAVKDKQRVGHHKII